MARQDHQSPREKEAKQLSHMLEVLHRHYTRSISYNREARTMQLKSSTTNTYDASMSKYSRSSAITGALPAAAELEEAISSTRFLFLSTPTSSVRIGGGDVDELVSSSDSSTSSPS
jgi:hypothetical protein